MRRSPWDDPSVTRCDAPECPGRCETRHHLWPPWSATGRRMALHYGCYLGRLERERMDADALYMDAVEPDREADREKLLYIVALMRARKVHKALDHLFDMVEHLLESAQDERCDRLFASFSSIDLDKLGVQLTTGLLTVTLRHKGRLPNRAAFFNQVRDWLQVREPARVERLLAGLE
jgi:hypothetical protein